MSKLPTTDSIEVLARFWDTRDVTDFEDELEEVEGSVFERASTGARNTVRSNGHRFPALDPIQ
jgi:protein tyrosine phosphatase (PTP) superfamily phosphohydrolase (DUF442 family)